jgi:hypothetical protein
MIKLVRQSPMFVWVGGRIARFPGRLEIPEAILPGAIFILD